MTKKEDPKNDLQSMTTQKVLITLPRPESERSPYFELSKKYNLDLDFYPFIKLEGIHARDFRKQKIDIQEYSGFIFTSRNAIDHFFRVCTEMKVNVSQENKYFCNNEAVALYLQKFIVYRKRKVFFGADSTNESLFEVIAKHKDKEKFLYVCSENQQDNEIVNWLKDNNCDFSLAFMYRSVNSDVKKLLAKNNYDMICFFTPSSIRSLFENVPGFQQNGTAISVFGSNTSKAAEEAGLELVIKAPQHNMPSMVAALDIYFSESKKD
ncbi:MAG: uroporphyrinogen-III synthase [Chitinophagaceae bacterium]|nr:uroporphyrinogen-III synthase [Chitinophagaceae bacterium]